MKRWEFAAVGLESGGVEGGGRIYIFFRGRGVNKESSQPAIPASSTAGGVSGSLCPLGDGKRKGKGKRKNRGGGGRKKKRKKKKKKATTKTS